MRVWVLVMLLLSGCCFDALALPTYTSPVIPPGTPTATGGPHMPGGPGSSIFGAITLASGFSPDPMIVTALATGGVPISSFATSCAGHASPTPSHHLTITGETALLLRIMAYPTDGTDLTIAVRGSDGRVRCNDDFDGLMPLVEDTFAPGEYDVWVGRYTSSPGSTTYDLGITTNLGVTPTNLRSPPPPGAPLVPGTPPPLPTF